MDARVNLAGDGATRPYRAGVNWLHVGSSPTFTATKSGPTTYVARPVIKELIANIMHFVPL